MDVKTTQPAFEAWMATSNYPQIADVALAKLPDGNYKSQLTFAGWQGWQGGIRFGIGIEVWAVFFSTEDGPNFGVELCTEGSLPATVHKVMFTNEQPTEDQKAEVAQYCLELYESSSLKFEDGGIELVRGMEAIVKALMERATTLAADRDYEDEQRCEQLRRADKAEAALTKLQTTLRELLAPQAEKIIAAVS